MRPDRVSTALAKWIGEVSVKHTCSSSSVRGEQPMPMSELDQNSGGLQLYRMLPAITMPRYHYPAFRGLATIHAIHIEVVAPFPASSLAALQTMGMNYVLQQPYNMAETYVETSPATPMFFVLFPGVDPTPWVESLARTLDITTENGGCAPNLHRYRCVVL